MKIKDLFNAYKQQISETKNVISIFEQSGMSNDFAKLDFGFFPIGSGILTDKSEIERAELTHCDIMILGNDFGTVDYVDKNCPNKREKDSNPTIKNLLGLDLNKETTFFTNLYLGLRISGKNTDPKNMLEDYQNFCFTFFKKQLEIINPKIVLCLGQEVGKSLKSYSSDFPDFSKTSISKLFADDKSDFIFNVNGRKFILIPHPSYAHINWDRHNIRQKVKEAIQL